MSTKTAFFLVSVLVIVLPYLFWRIGSVRRVMPLAVAQILVGVALGPTLLGRAAPDLFGALFARPVLSLLDGVSALGVLLYVFVTGLHLRPGLLKQDARRLGALAAGSVAVPLLLGAIAGAVLLRVLPAEAGIGGGLGFVAAVAICVAVTALPVLAAVLAELDLLRTRIGQTALAVAALNDAALWIMLVPVLAVASGIGGARAAIGLLLAAGWFVLVFGLAPRLLHRLNRREEAGTVVFGVGFAVLSAGVSEALGTGYLIGAFAAGAAMPESARAALLERLERVTAAVLLPFFFMSTGLKARIDPSSAAFLLTFAATTAATILGKVAGTTLPARRAGFSWTDSLSLGAMMQTKGLMEVVVLAILHDAGLIGAEAFSGMVAMAVFCTVITAPLVRLCDRGATIHPDARRS